MRYFKFMAINTTVCLKLVSIFCKAQGLLALKTLANNDSVPSLNRDTCKDLRNVPVFLAHCPHNSEE